MKTSSNPVHLHPRRYGTNVYSRAQPSAASTPSVHAPHDPLLAHPPRYNVMTAPVLQSTPEPPRRAGADDHLRHKSRGF